MSSDSHAGRIHLEPSHRVVAETVAARVHSNPDQREAVDVKCDDFDGATYYVSVAPEEKNILRVSLYVNNYKEIVDAVGGGHFQALYSGMISPNPVPGYSLTLVVDLDQLPADAAARDELVKKMSTMKRDVVGAPLWITFKSLLDGVAPPSPFYVVNYRPEESMYIVPSNDLVIVVYSIVFENQVEQAIARAFLQEIEISRRQSRDLAVAPSVTYTTDPPRELKMLKGVTIKSKGDCAHFIGFVSLAISKRNVEGGKLEKAVSLMEGYRSYLMYHVKATKSQLHTRIRARSSTWLQVLNRAMPEKLNVEKKTVKGRTFKR